MPTKSAFSIVGLAHKLLQALEAQGYTPELVNRLAENPQLITQMLHVQMGWAKVMLEYRATSSAELGNLDRPIDDLELSVRSVNSLKNSGVRTLRDLVTRNLEQILAVKNFGRSSAREIVDFLETLKLGFGMVFVGDHIIHPGFPPALILAKMPEDLEE